jgi:hypothetical protein
MVSNLLEKRQFESVYEIKEAFWTYLKLHVKFYVKEYNPRQVQ